MTETEIATAVRAYWNARGYAVDVAPRDVAVKGNAGTGNAGTGNAGTGNAGTVHYIYVRSNLIGGLPPGYRDLTTSVTVRPIAVCAACHSERGPPVHRVIHKYDTKTLAQMRRLWEDAPELAAAGIGKRFGVSKNAVISQANRRGWKHRRKFREPTATTRRRHDR